MRKYIDLIETLLGESFTGNVEKTGSLNGINYDQVHGLGQVPNNENVDYMGFSAIMKPSAFLSLAAPRDFKERSSIEHIMDVIKSGGAIGSPFLLISFADADKVVVKGHEGRTRCEAIRRLNPQSKVLVHCLLTDGDRARHISVDDIKKANMAMQKEQSPLMINGPFFDAIKHNGEWTSL